MLPPPPARTQKGRGPVAGADTGTAPDCSIRVRYNAKTWHAAPRAAILAPAAEFPSISGFYEDWRRSRVDFICRKICAGMSVCGAEGASEGASVSK